MRSELHENYGIYNMLISLLCSIKTHDNDTTLFDQGGLGRMRNWEFTMVCVPVGGGEAKHLQSS